MPYRTKTYIAANWDIDFDLVSKLRAWNDSENRKLHFLDAHELTQARDSSLNCSIKKSLAERLAYSKRFVLIVGSNTTSAKAGSCSYCKDYMTACHKCYRGHPVDMRSFIQFECEYAASNIPDIVVLYNSSTINKNKCPECLRNKGNHLSAYYFEDGRIHWMYYAIKHALGC